MSKKLIEDAEMAFEAWKDAPSGSYLEGTLAQAISRDLFPAMIEALRSKTDRAGFKEDK